MKESPVLPLLGCLHFALLTVLLLLPGHAAERTGRSVQGTRIPVIFDTDIGDDIDDTWALGLLLRCPELHLKLVVGDNGKPQYRAKLLAKFLEAAGRSDVEVGIGADVNRQSEELQSQWIKDYDLQKYPGQIRQDGVQAIIDTIMESPRPVTVIAVGPVQNIAEALRREPRIAQRARFVGMHGSVRVGYANDPKICAEYNVKVDPKACQKVFSAPWEITITPLDTCARVHLAGAPYLQVFNSKNPVARAIIANYRVWAAARDRGAPKGVESASTTLYDTVAVYLAFRQDWCSMERLGIRVTSEGLTLEDPTAKMMNVAMAWKDLEAFEHFLAEQLTRNAD